MHSEANLCSPRVQSTLGPMKSIPGFENARIQQAVRMARTHALGGRTVQPPVAQSKLMVTCLTRRSFASSDIYTELASLLSPA